MTYDPTTLGLAANRTAWSGPAIMDILDERQRQDDKFGADRNLDPLLWQAVLTEEVGEAAQGALHQVFGGPAAEGYRAELVQVAAVALAMIEAYDRNGGVVHPGGYWTKPTGVGVTVEGPAITGVGHSAGHFRKSCSCGQVIAQCRCLGPKREIVVQDGCPDCARKAANAACAGCGHGRTWHTTSEGCHFRGDRDLHCPCSRFLQMTGARPRG